MKIFFFFLNWNSLLSELGHLFSFFKFKFTLVANACKLVYLLTMHWIMTLSVYDADVLIVTSEFPHPIVWSATIHMFFLLSNFFYFLNFWKVFEIFIGRGLLRIVGVCCTVRFIFLKIVKYLIWRSRISLIREGPYQRKSFQLFSHIMSVALYGGLQQYFCLDGIGIGIFIGEFSYSLFGPLI